MSDFSMDFFFLKRICVEWNDEQMLYYFLDPNSVWKSKLFPIPYIVQEGLEKRYTKQMQ